ncbi:MAG TPA: HRDC domain-containing protein, partial [Terriglobia bacterium]|nr:HRDC domain-containing protein [Terriglobia bacterium]
AVNERTPVNFLMKEMVLPPETRKKKRKPKAPEGRKKAPEAAARPEAANAKGTESSDAARLEAALRAWRLAEARRAGLPAFRIFSDRTLRALAASRPATTEGLLAIPGIGISKLEKYGRDICRVLRGNGD